ncbi:MAG: hypothetical protein QOJ35_725 [Solirubrobacteraceae bacterium]|jgi:hypothetical protein|nr:hypothetical protein [Solirubrobacteraceae bacterium]
MTDPDDGPATLTDDEIETRRFDGSVVAAAADDATDTGDDSGDAADSTDTGDDSGDAADTGDDSGDTADTSDTGDDS